MKRIPECHPDKKHGAHGLCVLCYNKWLKSVNPEYKRRSYQSSLKATRNSNGKFLKSKSALKRRYGLTYETYLQMIQNQGAKCLICKLSKQLVIDHDHKTKIVRGLVCQKCNIFIGHIESSGHLIIPIVDYLRRSSQ